MNNLLTLFKDSLSESEYERFLSSISQHVDMLKLVDDVYHLNKKTFLDVATSIPRDLLQKVLKKDPQNKFLRYANSIVSKDHMSKLKAFIGNDELYTKLISSTRLIDIDDYTALSKSIPHSFAAELINLGMKNSVILKLSRPYSYIIK